MTFRKNKLLNLEQIHLIRIEKQKRKVTGGKIDEKEQGFGNNPLWRWINCY